MALVKCSVLLALFVAAVVTASPGEDVSGKLMKLQQQEKKWNAALSGATGYIMHTAAGPHYVSRNESSFEKVCSKSLGGLLGGDKASLPPQEHLLGGDKASLPPQEHLLGGDKASRPHQKHLLGEDKASLPPQEHLLGGDKASLPPQEHLLGEDKASLPPQEHLLGEDKASRPHQKHLLGEDKASLPPQEQLLGADEASLPPQYRRPGRRHGRRQSRSLLGGDKASLPPKKHLLGEDDASRPPITHSVKDIFSLLRHVVNEPACKVDVGYHMLGHPTHINVSACKALSKRPTILFLPRIQLVHRELKGHICSLPKPIKHTVKPVSLQLLMITTAHATGRANATGAQVLLQNVLKSALSRVPAVHNRFAILEKVKAALKKVAAPKKVAALKGAATVAQQKAAILKKSFLDALLPGPVMTPKKAATVAQKKIAILKKSFLGALILGPVTTPKKAVTLAQKKVAILKKSFLDALLPGPVMIPKEDAAHKIRGEDGKEAARHRMTGVNPAIYGDAEESQPVADKVPEVHHKQEHHRPGKPIRHRPGKPIRHRPGKPIRHHTTTGQPQHHSSRKPDFEVFWRREEDKISHFLAKKPWVLPTGLAVMALLITAVVFLAISRRRATRLASTDSRALLLVDDDCSKDFNDKSASFYVNQDSA